MYQQTPQGTLIYQRLKGHRFFLLINFKIQTHMIGGASTIIQRGLIATGRITTTLHTHTTIIIPIGMNTDDECIIMVELSQDHR